jgi:4-oxalocrotonate tautomerase
MVRDAHGRSCATGCLSQMEAIPGRLFSRAEVMSADDDVSPTRHDLGGSAACLACISNPIHERQKETEMPEVHVYMAAGRTDGQKKGMMLGITRALVDNLAVSPEVVTVQIIEAPLTDKMKNGQTFEERQADGRARR